LPSKTRRAIGRKSTDAIASIRVVYAPFQKKHRPRRRFEASDRLNMRIKEKAGPRRPGSSLPRQQRERQTFQRGTDDAITRA
jgi:hypothetical protein